ncbi:telethonin-like [Leptodactylus fuscus]|uniref:telethonin-like n=1 Tax=Leptodactylus fuscus TaxID=238119 RepID=UPI003F4F2002
MDMKSKSDINSTVLSCSMHEENLDKKESCTWQWDDLTVESRPRDRKTISEFDAVNKEGYKQAQQTVFLVQRSPLQTIKGGILGGYMQSYKLPYKNLLSVPLFVPSRLHAADNLSPADLSSKQKMTHTNGLYTNKQDITRLINSLPTVIKPTKLQVVSLITPPPSLYNANTH